MVTLPDFMWNEACMKQKNSACNIIGDVILKENLCYEKIWIKYDDTKEQVSNKMAELRFIRRSKVLMARSLKTEHRKKSH
jgi:uncharacterized protein YlbG (UPF0298 family)